uniref:Uncharacterized protein n=1 Tax=Cyprinus carpio carpio TaxID=630221 RepID=A0A9J7Z817_CYPCA
MIKRDGRGHSYCAARGEILGPAQDGRKRKHLPRMFSLIKNESRRSVMPLDVRGCTRATMGGSACVYPAPRGAG